MGEVLNQEQLRQRMTAKMQNIMNNIPAYQRDLLAASTAAYEKKWHTKMSPEKQAVLANSLKNMEAKLLASNHTKEMIAQATQDLSKVENPITLLFNLMSILIPNFAYTEAIGIQPLPTKKSPIYYPQIVANESRNGVAKGTVLLGAQNWNTTNTYSTNRNTVDTTTSVTGTDFAFTAPEGNIIPGTFVAKVYIAGTGTALVADDGNGEIPAVDGYTTGTGSVNYGTGEVTFPLAAALGADDTIESSYRYEFSDATKPAQVILEWTDKPVTAQPYRLRSKYDLDNFYQAKQVLAGYDIDEVLSTSLVGYINAEISGNVFDDILLKADADYAWSSAEPAGVAWALHRLSIVQTFVEAGNGIRQNIKRSGGNVAICGTDFMNIIETLGEDLWKPVSQTAEPIGPYVAGTLANRFKIIKHQEYPGAKAAMVYKASETEASVLGGSFISLYSTPPIAHDDLTVDQGLGTQFAYEKAFENSIVSLTMN